MDLLGENAGTEPFLLDGETTLQLVLDGPPLLVGKDATLSLQILHAYHILENTILEYHHKSANFELPSGTIRSTLHFRRSVLTKTDLSENKHLSIQTGHSTFAFSSRALACPMLFVHLLKPPVVVHVFDSLEDLAWQEYKVTKKPMDGGIESTAGENDVQNSYFQRIFLLKIHAHGIPLALLKGAE